MTAPVDTRRTTPSRLEVRSDGDQLTVDGYASTFDQPYDMGWYSESVASGAFTKTLSERPDVRFLINHDGLPLARTSSNTLTLAQDERGLRVRATLDPADPDVQRILPKLQRGDLDQMSFAFRTIRDEWDDVYENRTLRELSLANGDVSVVTYPANPNATIGLRAAKIVNADHDELRAAYRAIREERVGKTISASTQRQLETVLENLDAIDEAQDSAVQTIAELIGALDQAGTRSGHHLSVVRARDALAELAHLEFRQKRGIPLP